MADTKWEEIKALIEAARLSNDDVMAAICRSIADRQSRCTSDCDLRCTSCEQGCSNGQ